MAAPVKPDRPRTAPAKGGAAKPGRATASTARKPAGPARSNMRLVAWVAAAIFLADQALKYLVVHVMQLDRVREIDVLPPWLNLRMAWNQGVNFGLLSSEQDIMRWALVAIAFAICIWVWIWVWRGALGRFARVSAGLLIGGALGNVVDRVLYGAVADFLNMSLPGWQNPYSFNLADISIFAGAIGLVLMPQTPGTAAPVRPKARAARPAQPPRPAQSPRPAPPSPQPQQGDLFSGPGQQGRDGDGKSG